MRHRPLPTKAGRTDAVLSAKILHLAAVLRFLEDRDDLTLAEAGLPHCHFLHHTLSMMAEVSSYDLSAMWGSLRSTRTQ